MLEGSHFLSKVFRGKVAPMMLHFIENEELSDKELQDLRELLERKGKQHGADLFWSFWERLRTLWNARVGFCFARDVI
ncbi:MAG: BlaI/MecI/CopY family transcriptional regulator [Mycobacterium sp.]|nr:BlaI/MecI/CopY family transcriptional regulator [Mycobacterium sp.]